MFINGNILVMFQDRDDHNEDEESQVRIIPRWKAGQVTRIHVMTAEEEAEEETKDEETKAEEEEPAVAVTNEGMRERG